MSVEQPTSRSTQDDESSEQATNSRSPNTTPVNIESEIKVLIATYEKNELSELALKDALTSLFQRAGFDNVLDLLFTRIFNACLPSHMKSTLPPATESLEYIVFFEVVQDACLYEKAHRSWLENFLHRLFDWYTKDETYENTEDVSCKITDFLLETVLAKDDSGGERAIKIIIDEFVQAIKSKSRLSPKVFSLLENAQEIQGTLNPAQRNEAICSILSLKWRTDYVTPLAYILNDNSLPTATKEIGIKRFLVQMEEASVSDLPALAYHIILMTKKCSNSSKHQFFLKLINIFDQKNTEDLSAAETSNLLLRESATLAHIGIALREDHKVCESLFFCVRKVPRKQRGPFNLTLMLIMTETKRFKLPLLSHIRDELVDSVRVMHDLGKIHWVKENRPFELPDAGKMMKALVARCSNNFEIRKPLIELSCMILDAAKRVTSKPLPAFQQADEQLSSKFVPGISLTPSLSRCLRKNVQDPTCPQTRLFEIGASTLLELFSAHREMQDVILGQIHSQIDRRQPGYFAYIELLRMFSKHQSHLLDHVSMLNKFLDQVRILPADEGFSLLQALLEVSTWNLAFRDNIIIFLRKCTADKDAGMREIAMRGAVELLLHYYSNQMPSRDIDQVLSLCRRCLSLSGNSQLAFYCQTISALERHPSISVTLLPIFVPHFLRYTRDCTFSFENVHCGAEIFESLPWLIRCCTRLISCSGENDCPQNRNLIIESLEKISNHWAEATLDVFGLTTTSQFGLHTDELRHSFVRAILSIMVLEALIEFKLLAQKSTNFAIYDKLDEKMHMISEFVRKAFQTDQKTKTNETPTLASDDPLLSATILCSLVDGIRPPRDQYFIKKFKLALSNDKATEVTEFSDACSIMSKLLLTLTSQTIAHVSESDIRINKISLIRFATESLELMLAHSLSMDWKENFLIFVENFSPNCSQASIQSQSPKIKASIAGDKLLQIVEDLLEINYFEESIPILRSLELISKNSPSNSIQSMAVNLVRTYEKKVSLSFLKAMFVFLIRVSDHCHGLSTLMMLARNLAYHCGRLDADDILSREGLSEQECNKIEEIDREVSLEDDEILSILSSGAVCGAVSNILCSEADRLLTEIDWVLKEFNSNYVKPTHKDINANLPDYVMKLLDGVCERISCVARATFVLSKTDLPSNATEPFMKLFLHCFATIREVLKIITSLTKNLPRTLIDAVSWGSKLHGSLSSFQLAKDKKNGGQKNNTSGGKSSSLTLVKTCSRLMGLIVEGAESFDLALMDASHTHEIFRRYLKRSTVRDFKMESANLSLFGDGGKKKFKKEVKPEKTNKA